MISSRRASENGLGIIEDSRIERPLIHRLVGDIDRQRIEPDIVALTEIMVSVDGEP